VRAALGCARALRARSHAAHLTHHNVSQGVGVVKAAVAGGRDDVVEVVGGQAEVGLALKRAVCVLDLDLLGGSERGMAACDAPCDEARSLAQRLHAWHAPPLVREHTQQAEESK